MALEFNTKMVSVVDNYLYSLKIPFTKDKLKNTLEWNPYYPSLYSVSETLNKLNIENKGLRVEKGLINELPLPFLAYIKDEKTGIKDFVNVKNVNQEQVSFFNGKEQVINKQDFLNNWDGVVLLGEKNNKSGEKDYKYNSKKEQQNDRMRLVILLPAILLLFYYVFGFVVRSEAFSWSSLLILNHVLGFMLSILLIIYEIDKSNVFVKNICTGGGIKSNCDAILTSNASKFLGVSWSEIGLCYFSSLILFLLISPVPFIQKTGVVAIASVLSSLYIPFSIYYQYQEAKQWCPLCLGVQSVLLLNLIVAVIFKTNLQWVGFQSIFHLVSCIILSITIWYFLKPVLIQAKNASLYMAAYKRIASHPEVFELKLRDRPNAPQGWQHLGISKGKDNSPVTIIKVCSPSCGHCSNALKITDELIEQNENVKLITLFLTTTNENDNRRLPVQYFLALSELGDENKLEKALNYWYHTKGRTIDYLKSNFSVSESLLKAQIQKIEEMQKWIKSANIEFTPTLFVNGRQLPETFVLSELKNIL